MDVTPVEPKNAASFIVSADAPQRNKTLVKAEQCPNAVTPMVVTEAGMMMLVSPESLKTSLRMVSS